MADEKLPEYVEGALNVFQDASTDKGGFMGPVGFDEAVRKMFLSKVDLRSAIHRFAREREASVMGREAKLPDLYWPHIVTPCACCRDLRQQWKALSGHGK